MLGKLFEILIASKAGALSGVLLLTGALVSVTTANGITTITLDQESPTPTVTVTATPTPTPTVTSTPTASPTPSASSAPEASTEPSACAADAHARNDARHRIREAFTKYHTALMQLRGDEHGRLNEPLHKADEMLHRIATGADEALRDIGCHDMKQGDRDNENDKDADEDNDDHAGASASPSATPSATPSPTPTPTPTATATPTTSAGTTAAAQMSEIADRAVAAMETVYNAAKALADQPIPTPSGQPKHGDRSHDRKHHDQTATPAPEPDEASD